jgi:hypothetical protein
MLNATPKTLIDPIGQNEESSPNNDSSRNVSTINPTDKSAFEQLQQIRVEAKQREVSRENTIEAHLEDNQKALKPNNELENELTENYTLRENKKSVKQTNSSKNIFDEDKKMEKKDEPKGYKPDLYVKEIVEKMAKSVKYEVNLVQLLHESQMTEEIFSRLFDGMADETHGLITRREEVLNELVSLMKGYESTVLSAQQGMKLLDLRKSIGDASDDEYIVKSAALNWDIKNYGNKILEGRQRSDYLKSLGKLVPTEELEELQKLSEKYLESVDSINVSNATQERIKQAMQEANSLLKAASEF